MKTIVKIIIAVLFLGGSAFAAPKNISKNSKKAETEKLQRALGVKQDGIIGPITRAAICKVQKAYGLRITGMADSATKRSIFAIETKSLSPAARTVVKDVAKKIEVSKEINKDFPSQTILRLQGNLITLGYSLKQTGKFDGPTKDALLQYQNGGWFRGKKGTLTSDLIIKIGKEAEEKTKKNPKQASVSAIAKSKIIRERTTKATVFGYKDKNDSGRGTPLMNPAGARYGGLNTNYRSCVGASLPIEILAAHWGIKPLGYRKGKPYWSWYDFAGPRMAGLQIYSYVTKRWHDPVPLKDVGPGKGPQARGVGLDVCAGTNREIGGNGMTRVKYRLIANVFPERSGLQRIITPPPGSNQRLIASR